LATKADRSNTPNDFWLYCLLVVNAARWADYFQTEEVLNIRISIQNQTDFLFQLITSKCYLISFSVSTFWLVCFCSMAECELN